MEEWGLSYGASVGYEDADDYDSWCSTWVMEQRLLVETAEDPASAETSLDERCSAQISLLQDGDCFSYWGMWD